MGRQGLKTNDVSRRTWKDGNEILLIILPSIIRDKENIVFIKTNLLKRYEETRRFVLLR